MPCVEWRTDRNRIASSSDSQDQEDAAVEDGEAQADRVAGKAQPAPSGKRHGCDQIR